MLLYACRACGTDIASVGDLQANSSVGAGGYALNRGDDYTIIAPVDISASSQSGLSFNGYTLTVDADTTPGSSLVVADMYLGEGTVNAVAGSAANSSAIHVTRNVQMTGGSFVDARGGGANTMGMRVDG